MNIEQHDDRVEVLREGITMMLYLSIVLLATFAALPIGSGDAGHEASGVHGTRLIALIWGTAFGLAIAHWFAFRLTAGIFGGGSVSGTDVRIGVAQLGAAAIVAGLCSIPVVLFDEGNDVEAATFVPALILGAAGFLVARAAGRSTVRSVSYGGVAMILGIAIAVIKNYLAGH